MMGTRLKEGQVIKSKYFRNGYIQNGIIHVGNYDEYELFQKYPLSDEYVYGKPSIDHSRADKEYLVLRVEEYPPRITVANRTSSYENKIIAIELNEDGTYNENNQKICFSTCYVYHGAIDEKDIEIVREMKKVYI